MSKRFQFGSELDVVVDSAIEHNKDVAGFVSNRLASGCCEVNDRKTPAGQENVWEEVGNNFSVSDRKSVRRIGQQVAEIVRATMG